MLLTVAVLLFLGGGRAGIGHFWGSGPVEGLLKAAQAAGFGLGLVLLAPAANSSSKVSEPFWRRCQLA